MGCSFDSVSSSTPCSTCCTNKTAVAASLTTCAAAPGVSCGIATGRADASGLGEAPLLFVASASATSGRGLRGDGDAVRGSGEGRSVAVAAAALRREGEGEGEREGDREVGVRRGLRLCSIRNRSGACRPTRPDLPVGEGDICRDIAAR